MNHRVSHCPSRGAARASRARSAAWLLPVSPGRLCQPLLRGLALACLTCAALAAPRHGGVYRGPGSTVGPGGASSGGPGGGSTGGAPDTDTASWSLWWSLNRDRYLGLRAAVRQGQSTTGDDDFYLGQGARTDAHGSLRPSPELVRERVVPALLKCLEERDIDMLTASLMALGKIGQEAAGPEQDLAAAISAFLAHANQEVHETAAIALGVLADPAQAPLLADLLHDSERGRELVGRGQVSLRARTFAAYGLGLIGSRSSTPSVRSYAVHHLAATLEEAPAQRIDLSVAAVLSLGLIPLEEGELPAADAPAPRVGASRQGQVLYLLKLLDDSGPKGLDARVRAQIPVAVARLARDARPPLASLVSQRLVRALATHSREDKPVQQGAVHALGILGDRDEDVDDVAIRRALISVAGTGDRIARNLAMLALARCATRPGAGQVTEGPSEVRDYLLKQLSQGTSAGRPWAALALGLYEHGNAREREPEDALVRSALRLAFEQRGSPSEAGALAIALGLAGERRCADEMISRLDSGDENLRANLATSLGLMGARSAIASLQALVRDTVYKPGVLREGAIALAMLGDKTAVTTLLARLSHSKGLMEQVALASALGQIGDLRSVDPLLEVLRDERLSDTTRAFAGVALGVICDKEDLPWNAKLAADLSWWEVPDTLHDPLAGKGIVDIF